MEEHSIESSSGDSILVDVNGSVYSCCLQGVDDIGSCNGDVVATITKRPNGRWDLFLDDGEDGVIELEDASLEEIHTRLQQWNEEVLFLCDGSILDVLFSQVLV